MSISIQRHWSAYESQFNISCNNPFLIMQWNYLADGLAQDGKFDDVELTHLAWDFRQSLIIHEIRGINPDIFCLQECNRIDTLSVEFQDYFMFWIPKLESPTLRLGCPPDGSAVFVRRTRYEIMNVDSLYYKSSGDSSKLSNQNASIIHVKDKQKHPNHSFLIVSTHLKAKKGYEDERADQVQQLMNHIHLYSNQLFNNDNTDTKSLPVIICGDFNDVPGSKMYSTVINSLSATSLNFQSAYSDSNEQKSQISSFHDEPSFTTWKFRKGEESKYTGDYIFYSNTIVNKSSNSSDDDLNVDLDQCLVNRIGLELQGTLILPTEAEISSHGLPNANYPSDHLSLVAKFAWS